MPLQADFNLPPCYQVVNIKPLRTRLQGFSDKTLFYIFYSMPRDITQECVAEELMSRKWRYHKVERAWLTRDESCPPPTPVEPRISERGVYFWWDTAEWKKVKVNEYDSIDWIGLDWTGRGRGVGENMLMLSPLLCETARLHIAVYRSRQSSRTRWIHGEYEFHAGQVKSGRMLTCIHTYMRTRKRKFGITKKGRRRRNEKKENHLPALHF